MRPPALDPLQVEPTRGSNYPDPFRQRVAARAKRKLGAALGLKNFGVNLTTLGPGAQSALRHWHARQDEFVYVLSGELVLITDAGEQVLKPGMAAGFPAGNSDAHYLLNRSGRKATYLEVGDRTPDDAVTYPDDDIDARMKEGRWTFTRKDGTAF
ncbi:MAG: Cupin domain protein [Betaproteobacteria bacterium]|nr:Cupin domain protein [Betaproteobacteria bacterium]